MGQPRVSREDVGWTELDAGGTPLRKWTRATLQLRPLLIGREQSPLLVPGRKFPALVLLVVVGVGRGGGLENSAGVMASLARWRHHFSFPSRERKQI